MKIVDKNNLLSTFRGEVEKEVQTAKDNMQKHNWWIQSGKKVQFSGYQPEVVYVLGELSVIGFCYSKNGSKESILYIKSFNKPPLLCADDSKMLYIVDKYKTINIEEILKESNSNIKQDIDKAVDNFEKFHWGKEYNNVYHFEYDSSLDDVYIVGTLALVGYITKKTGDRGETLYVHAFHNPPPLLVKDDKNRLHILGGGYNVENRGIVG